MLLGRWAFALVGAAGALALPVAPQAEDPLSPESLTDLLISFGVSGLASVSLVAAFIAKYSYTEDNEQEAKDYLKRLEQCIAERKSSWFRTSQQPFTPQIGQQFKSDCSNILMKSVSKKTRSLIKVLEEAKRADENAEKSRKPVDRPSEKWMPQGARGYTPRVPQVPEVIAESDHPRPETRIYPMEADSSRFSGQFAQGVKEGSKRGSLGAAFTLGAGTAANTLLNAGTIFPQVVPGVTRAIQAGSALFGGGGLGAGGLSPS